VPRRRKSLIEALAHRVGVEARRLSLLSTTLHDLRKALGRLTRELVICAAILIGIWHLMADTLSRLISSLWR
jgi:hypothetical protein